MTLLADEVAERTASHRPIGTVGLIAGVWLVIGNLSHPIGSTEQYTVGEIFVENSNTTYWIVNHLLLATALLLTPWLAWGWRDRMQSARARSWATFGLFLAVMGTTVGTIHLGGIDGAAIPSFSAVLDANPDSETVRLIADGILRVHLTTIIAWSLLLWGAAQTAFGVAELLEGARTRLYGGLLVMCGVLGFAFAVTIAVQGHLSSFSEGVLLRGSSVGFTVWFFWTAWQLRQSPITLE